MKPRLKPIDEQVIVITGASSGIGLATARLAARRGARVVLAARGADALDRAVDGIRADGGVARRVSADVTQARDLERLAQTAITEFGCFDTWVNCAAVAIYGRVDEVPLEDQRRLFETNFWGVVQGSLAALPRLRARGGALINLGSMVSDIAIPLQGIYCASKHAVKAYTNALRLEVEAEGAPISVTLIKPGAIDTPYFEHARNYMERAPKPPPPVYAPDAVARAILRCATYPVREVIVGGAARAMLTAASLSPRAADRVMERTMFSAQKSDRPATANRDDNLYHPDLTGPRERGRLSGPVLSHSLYTSAVLHPARTVLAAAGVGLAVAAGMRALRE